MKIIRTTAVVVSLSALISMAGCKAQQQMQQQLADLDAKLSDSQRRITALDGELKKTNVDVNEMKSLVTKLGDVVVNLQKAEEERQRKAAEDAAAAAAAAKKKPAAKKRH